MAQPVSRMSAAPRARLPGYLQLLRPANLPTAAADSLAGAFIVGAALPAAGLIAAASVLLYAGGVVLNDAFDAALDARERPERPIPAGRVSPLGAYTLGALLLILGIATAAFGGATSAVVGIALAAAVLGYDGHAKHRALLGPLVMGGCRALNLLLGLSLVPVALFEFGLLALLPFAHVFALTAFARGEVGGGRRAHASAALLAVALVSAVLLALAVRHGAWPAIVLAAGYALICGVRYAQALARPDAARVRLAVKQGVIALVLLDAALVAVYAGPVYALAVAALWPLSAVLARRFAVA